jgi:hypothetical protein
MNIVAWKGEVQNGRIPDEKLRAIVPIDYDVDLHGAARLAPEAAYNYELMRAAMVEDGVSPIAISYSYRTYAKQLEKWDNYQAGGNVAAPPGTSNHGWGLAVDLNISRRSDSDWRPMPGLSEDRYNWLKAHPQYGFRNNDAQSEPWHWDYEGGGFDLKEEDDMSYAEFKEGVKRANDGKSLPDNATADFKFGYQMETRGTTLPKAEDQTIVECTSHCSCRNPHSHNVIGKAE